MGAVAVIRPDGPQAVTYEVVPEDLRRELWVIYDENFAPLNEDCPTRQSFDRDEFFEAMEDERYGKIIVFEDDLIVGFGMLTKVLELVPWISVPFYEKRFAAEIREGKFFYIQTLVVKRKKRGTKAVQEVMMQIVRSFHVPGGVACFDHSGLNRALPLLISKVGGDFIGVPIDLGTQHYWALRLEDPSS
jgi:hypothetical protein